MTDNEQAEAVVQGLREWQAGDFATFKMVGYPHHAPTRVRLIDRVPNQGGDGVGGDPFGWRVEDSVGCRYAAHEFELSADLRR